MIASLFGAAALAFAPTESAKDAVDGTYLCTTAARAGIASLHLVGSGPPSSFVDKDVPTRFKMRIDKSGDAAKPYRAVEIGYEGDDKDQAVWQDENSVLHSTYLGTGDEFEAVEGPAFLSFYRKLPGDADGDFAFYHAGFELPGGEDTQLAVRWGQCRKLDQGS